MFDACAVVLFVLMLIGYHQSWAWLRGMDQSAIRMFAALGAAHPGWVAANDLVSTAFGPMSFRIIGLVALLVALSRRAVRMALFLLVTVGAGGTINELVKRATDRPRPDEALVSAFSSAFPSGHAFGVVVGVLSIGVVIWPLIRRRWLPHLVAVGALLVVAVGFSRVALVVHHVSDVIAGWSWGLLWWSLCFALIRPDTDRVWSKLIRAGAGELTAGTQQPGRRRGVSGRP